jgi:hypothetical protein
MKELSSGAWDERLMCHAVSLTYDFGSHTGRLFLPGRDRCDMTGCVKMFEGIDPKVTAIQTYSGNKPTTMYRKDGGEWRAR